MKKAPRPELVCRLHLRRRPAFSARLQTNKQIAQPDPTRPDRPFGTSEDLISHRDRISQGASNKLDPKRPGCVCNSSVQGSPSVRTSLHGLTSARHET